MNSHGGSDELDSTRSFKYIAAGAMVSHYRIIKKIGEGAMGQVYLAEDVKLKRRVALKFLPYDLTRDEEARRRFLQEARAASSLDHPHICNIHEIEETPDGRTFISMSYYEGETLKQKIENGSLDVAGVVGIALEICDGLGRAHEAGVVHRDIKPGNIIITDRGKAKILDFGLAKLAGETQLTRTGITVGTALYMSPEQARGETVDARSDIWSVGVVLYEALTGRRPFRGANSSAVIYSILHDDPTPVEEIDRNLPGDLSDIVDRCLRKDPGARYQSAADLRDALEKFREEQESGGLIAVPMPSFARGRALRRVGLPAGVAVIAVIALLLTPLGRRLASWVGVEDHPGERRVLLLDFDLEGENVEQEIYCQGLLEYIGYRLSGLESPGDSLWTVSRYSAIASDLSDPGRSCLELGANVAVAGRLVCRGDSLELSLERYDLASGGSATLTRSLTLRDHRANLVTWQDSTVIELAHMLEARLSPGLRQQLRSGQTIVPAAFEAYLLGTGYLESTTGAACLDSSIAYTERALHLDPSYALAHSALARACRLMYRRTGEAVWADRCMAECRDAISMDPRAEAARVTLASLQAALGDTVGAIATLNEAMAISPVYRASYPRLASLEMARGDTEAAELAYRAATQARPRDAIALWDFAKFCYRAGKYEEAVDFYEKALDLAPDNTWFLSGLAAAYDAMGNHAEAMGILERSLEIKPDYQTYTNLGTFYFYDTRFADAARMYSKALEINPDAWYSVWGSLAECYYWMPGMRDTALVLLEHTATLAEREMAERPEGVDIVADLASYYVELGREAEARRLIESGSHMGITDPGTEFRIAEVYETLGERDKALEWATRAIASGFPPEYVVKAPRLRGIVADGRFRDIPQVRAYLENEG
jgi:tetratricopeptide (TPR) repeat protein/tRNA A-37 threonylcarbamoyl transferase component Bud32